MTVHSVYFEIIVFNNIFSIYHLIIIVEARIEETYSSIGAIQTQIRSQFKVAMLQQSRSVRSMKVEDFYYNNIDNANNLDLTVECAKVAVSVSNDVNNEVKTTVKGTWIFILDIKQNYQVRNLTYISILTRAHKYYFHERRVYK